MTNVLKLIGSALGLLVAAVLLTLLIPLALLNILLRVPGVSHVLKRWRFMDRFYKPTLTVEKLDDEGLPERFGPAITGLVRANVTAREDRYGLAVSGQTAVSTALDSFKDTGETAKTAVALIRFFYATLPRRRFVLSGELQPAGVAGPGVSLALARDDAYDAFVALWAEPFGVHEPGAAAYQRMAIPAAAWVDYQLTEGLLGRKLLSQSAVSWAFFRAGLESHRTGDIETARSLYEQAIGHDGRNVGALANLGLLERRAKEYERALNLLRRALEELTREGVPEVTA